MRHADAAWACRVHTVDARGVAAWHHADSVVASSATLEDGRRFHGSHLEEGMDRNVGILWESVVGCLHRRGRCRLGDGMLGQRRFLRDQISCQGERTCPAGDAILLGTDR